MEIRNARKGDFDAIVSICTPSMIVMYGHIFSEEKMHPSIEGRETEKYVRRMRKRP